MSRLSNYYNTRVMSGDKNDFLKQVAHTERGKSITNSQFDSMVSQICNLLKLGPEDNLLDLCCGNGVITHHLAKKVQFAVGIDFSRSLIEVAREHHHADNLRYHVLNVMELERLKELENVKFTKILMFAALQHFNKIDFEPLLKNVLSFSVENPLILLGFVPEKDKKKAFYNTPKRKFVHIVRLVTGRDIFGTWWEKEFISRTCDKFNLRCSYHDIDQSLDASRYRFDVIIR